MKIIQFGQEYIIQIPTTVMYVKYLFLNKINTK